MQPTIVCVPVPPSVNELFKTLPNGRRSKSKVYKDWLAEAGWKLRLQRPPRAPGHVVLLISVDRPSLAADIDNRAKALIDLLVSQKVIDDDKHVVGLAIAWADAGAREARVMILPSRPIDVLFRPEPAVAGAGGWYLNPQPEGAA